MRTEKAAKRSSKMETDSAVGPHEPGEVDTMSDHVYFTTLDYMHNRFDIASRRMAMKAETADELQRWQHEVQAILARTLGLDTMRTVPLQPCITEQLVYDGYLRQRIEIQTEPGVVMPLFALVPLDLRAGERRPCMIAPHGHGSGGKVAVAGCRDDPDVVETIDKHHYDYGVQLVRRGFVVYCPDARGFGERREIDRQSPADRMGGSCDLLNHMAMPLGQTVTGMWTWDLMRLIDYIATRSDCDVSRLGCAGLSGGGLQTLWLAALDGRVKLRGGVRLLLWLQRIAARHERQLLVQLRPGPVAAC